MIFLGFPSEFVFLFYQNTKRMKKFTLFIVMLLIAGTTSAGVHFGIKLGYNGNKLSTNLDSISSQFKSGLHIGAFARIGKRVYFGPELYYSLQGAEYVFDAPLEADSWTQKLTIGTLDVPLNVGFRIINNNKFNLRIMAGPMASFVVNSKIKSTGTITDPITKASLNTVNWYIQAGAGMDLWFVTLDIRYQAGLNQMIEQVGTWNFDTRNNVFVVSLGFKIF
jgi:hypothetical protein